MTSDAFSYPLKGYLSQTLVWTRINHHTHSAFHFDLLGRISNLSVYILVNGGLHCDDLLDRHRLWREETLSVSCKFPGAGDPNPDSDPTFIPPREIFTSSEYRANWSNPHSGVPQVAFDVIAPIDAINGRGHGWTVFFTHGLGAMNASDGYRWRDFLLSTYSDPVTGNSVGNLTGLNFIFPKAPVRPITVYAAQTNQGARPGWFDIKDWRDLHYLEDEEGLRQSAIGLASILNNEALAGKIQLNQTIIAGFSQGSVMSLLLTLTLPQPPAACIMLSGYLPLPLRLIDLRSPSLAGYKKTSFYWLHGTDDPILIYNQARAGMKLFSSLFADRFLRGKFKTFQGLKHGFNPAEQKVVTNYIDGMVSRNSGGIIDSTFDAQAARIALQPQIGRLAMPQRRASHSIARSTPWERLFAKS
ncbi:hypothetical protein KEM48_012319 [Puccinia striiformis f. sp. tritici PST-130]|nr:hypothetical protein KEM48_012319 [Puccinia striiformis f. sp. tritici PST-130]